MPDAPGNPLVDDVLALLDLVLGRHAGPPRDLHRVHAVDGLAVVDALGGAEELRDVVEVALHHLDPVAEGGEALSGRRRGVARHGEDGADKDRGEPEEGVYDGATLLAGGAGDEEGLGGGLGVHGDGGEEE